MRWWWRALGVAVLGVLDGVAFLCMCSYPRPLTRIDPLHTLYHARVYKYIYIYIQVPGDVQGL